MHEPADEGWEFLLTDVGREHLDEVMRLSSEGASTDDLGRMLRRRGDVPARVAALLTQLQLRRQAEQKFGHRAAALLFTRAGLEQATRAPVAAVHAQRYVAAGVRRVADLGCGIGSESLALLAAGLDVRAVELDPFTARIAEHNLSLFASAGSYTVTQADAETAGPGDADAVFLDPARRTAGHRDTRRLTSHADYSPSLDFAFALAERLPTGIKLGPGFNRALIPADAEAQWVSVSGQLVETGLWFGSCARPGIRRAALLLRTTDEGAIVQHELVAAHDAPDADVRARGAYLYEPDNAVIRARLIGQLADTIGAGMLSEGIAYLTADAHVETPFAQCFRVIDELPVRERDLKRALAARDIGTLEIKKRGIDVDPAALRQRLRLRGKAAATLILTRAAGAHVAYLVERVSSPALTRPESA